MKNLNVLIIVVGLLFSANASAQNLIKNGDFENSAGWHGNARQSDLDMTYAEGQGIDGSIALKLATTDLGGGDNPFYVVANNTFFSVTQNTNIKITFWAKAIPAVAGEDVEFTPFLQEADDYSFTNFEKTSVTSRWVEYTLTTEITSSTSEKYKLKFRIPSEGVIFFDNVTVEEATSTDVNTLEVSNSASIYPNPTSSILNIRSNSSMVKYSIFNLCGKKVLSGVGQQVDVSVLKSGLYMLTLDDGSHLKFIKE